MQLIIILLILRIFIPYLFSFTNNLYFCSISTSTKYINHEQSIKIGQTGRMRLPE